MAENPIASAGDNELAQEIARLKTEVANLKSALAERAEDIAHGASRAAEVVTQPIKNNPGTAGLLFGGIIGMIMGIALGQAINQQPQRWYDRYR
ncbi:MAG: hypothetical protein KF810_07095 [Rhizobiaceae bacterium]|nr:hypothetical protein [Rhizobiaceae bacterium]